MRAIAISSVLIAHGALFFGVRPFFNSIYPYGYFGVDLFFVLSGFLIGEILFRSLLRKRDKVGLGTLGNFWMRRWLRTLPNYYLFILINIAIAFWFAQRLPPIWKYLVFLQNLNHPPSIFFTESWTLAVEVWFYLLTPILFFAALKIAPSKFRISTLLIIVASIIVVTIVRSRDVAHLRPLPLFGARMTVIYRLDACMFGMFAAWVKQFFPEWFPRGRWIVFAAGLVVIGFGIFFVGHPGHSVFYRRASFTATSLGAMMVLPLMDSWRAVPSGGQIVVRMSLWAYSLYMANLPVRKIVEHFFTGSSPLVNCLVFLLFCFIVAELTYTFFERPMMDLRDRWPFRRRPLEPERSALENQTAGV